jgi:hypothetical protein
MSLIKVLCKKYIFLNLVFFFKILIWSLKLNLSIEEQFYGLCIEEITFYFFYLMLLEMSSYNDDEK